MCGFCLSSRPWGVSCRDRAIVPATALFSCTPRAGHRPPPLPHPHRAAALPWLDLPKPWPSCVWPSPADHDCHSCSSPAHLLVCAGVMAPPGAAACSAPPPPSSPPLAPLDWHSPMSLSRSLGRPSRPRSLPSLDDSLPGCEHWPGLGGGLHAGDPPLAARRPPFGAGLEASPAVETRVKPAD